ncbi:MAG TPA: helix-turn-helix domain-containing protein [Solirubrobacteraceae bacterium]|jgi:AcrR family transcriptional regulator|nr:helix-turn-helix domain-containing protein [Solirubrobacteraceae bacterium]
MAALARRTAFADAARQRGEAAFLKATAELLEEGTPFGELAIETIARRAGYSRATFYAYFRDKRELVLEMGERFATAILEVAGPWLEEREDDLTGTLTAMLRVFQAHRGALSALVETSGYDAEVAAFWRSLHERFLLAADERIGQSAPKMPFPEIEARAFAMVWMTERCLSEHVLAPRVREAELIEALAGQWEAALRP